MAVQNSSLEEDSDNFKFKNISIGQEWYNARGKWQYEEEVQGKTTEARQGLN